MDREEYIQRATESFKKYIDAFRAYDNNEGDTYERLMDLRGKLLEILDWNSIPLGIELQVDEEGEKIYLNKILSEKDLSEREEEGFIAFLGERSRETDEPSRGYN